MRRKSRKNVGLIGLGIIGTRAAASLRAAGYQVFVWNRTPKPVPNFLASAAEVAEVCENIQIFVADAQALMSVLESIREKLTAEHVIICNATVGPEATVEASKLVQETGARFLDAPFTGSKLAAERQQLVYYIGGDETTFLRVKPILEATSKAIVHIGGIGDAAIVKVATNLISAASVQVLSEALTLVKKAGLAPEALAAALEHNGARSGVMELKLPKMLGGDYEPHFSLKHMFKDVQLGIQMANALDVEAPVTSVTAGVMFGAIKSGFAEEDFAVIHRANEEAAGESRPGARPPLAAAARQELGDKEKAGTEPGAPAGTPAAAPPANVPLVTGVDEDQAESPEPNRPSHIFARIFGEDDEPAPPATPQAANGQLPQSEEPEAGKSSPTP